MSNPTISKGYTWASGATVMPTRLNNSVDDATLQCTQTNILIGRSTSGAGEAEEIACTAAGRTLIGKSSLAAQQAYLGVGEQRARVGTQFDKTDTTLANVTDLSVTVVNAGVYGFEALLSVTQNVTGQSKVALSGTATVAALVGEVISTEQSITAMKYLGRISALNSGVANTSSSVTNTIYLIKGTLVASADGTFTVQFAQNSASGTSSVLVGSSLRIWPIT